MDLQIESYTLRVLNIIKEAQQTHGLRHGDYQRYRQYCSRRIRRIRRSLNFLQGTKHKVIPKKVTEVMLTDIKYLYLMLMDAERSWSYAMQLKAEANTEPRKKFHMLRKLRKAVAHSDSLAAICNSDKCDARTKLEVQAYNSWMTAQYKFEREQWKEAIDLFSNAKTIYEKLATAFVDEERELYLQRVEELSPNIRYCAYNIGDESAIEDLRQMRLKSGREDPLTSKLDELIEKTREKQAATLSEVTWRGRTIPVKNEAVRVFLLSVADSEEQMRSSLSIDSKLSVLETSLKELVDAQQSLRDECKDDMSFKAAIKGQRLDDKVPNTVYLHTYLSYLKLTKTIERNKLMIDSLTSSTKGCKPQDVARLYDIIIQSLSEVVLLPGLDDDNELIESVHAQELTYKSHRCYWSAETYATLKKWKEALALYDKVLNYAQTALNALKNISDSLLENLVQNLNELCRKAEEKKFSIYAKSILDSSEDNSQLTLSPTDERRLIERLDIYAEDTRLIAGKKSDLIQFPPDFQPTHVKPLLFDLALSHIKMPSIEDKLETKAKGGAIAGVLGWFWGSKK